MYDDKNLIHFFTILEAIEKINFYTENFQDDEDFYFANKQMNFNAVVNLLSAYTQKKSTILLF